jgi:hypothetical protein
MMMAGSASEGNNPSSPWTRAEFFILGAILLVTFLLYSPTLGYQFVYDDRLLILQNPQLLSWRFVPQFFRESFASSVLPGAASDGHSGSPGRGN